MTDAVLLGGNGVSLQATTNAVTVIRTRIRSANTFILGFGSTQNGVSFTDSRMEIGDFSASGTSNTGNGLSWTRTEIIYDDPGNNQVILSGTCTSCNIGLFIFDDTGTPGFTTFNKANIDGTRAGAFGAGGVSISGDTEIHFQGDTLVTGTDNGAGGSMYSGITVLTPIRITNTLPARVRFSGDSSEDGIRFESDITVEDASFQAIGTGGCIGLAIVGGTHQYTTRATVEITGTVDAASAAPSCPDPQWVGLAMTGGNILTGTTSDVALSGNVADTFGVSAAILLGLASASVTDSGRLSLVGICTRNPTSCLGVGVLFASAFTGTAPGAITINGVANHENGDGVLLIDTTLSFAVVTGQVDTVLFDEPVGISLSGNTMISSSSITANVINTQTPVSPGSSQVRALRATCTTCTFDSSTVQVIADTSSTEVIEGLVADAGSLSFSNVDVTISVTGEQNVRGFNVLSLSSNTDLDIQSVVTVGTSNGDAVLIGNIVYEGRLNIVGQVFGAGTQCTGVTIGDMSTTTVLSTEILSITGSSLQTANSIGILFNGVSFGSPFSFIADGVGNIGVSIPAITVSTRSFTITGTSGGLFPNSVGVITNGAHLAAVTGRIDGVMDVGASVELVNTVIDLQPGLGCIWALSATGRNTFILIDVPHQLDMESCSVTFESELTVSSGLFRTTGPSTGSVLTFKERVTTEDSNFAHFGDIYIEKGLITAPGGNLVHSNGIAHLCNLISADSITTGQTFAECLLGGGSLMRLVSSAAPGVIDILSIDGDTQNTLAELFSTDTIIRGNVSETVQSFFCTH